MCVFMLLNSGLLCQLIKIAKRQRIIPRKTTHEYLFCILPMETKTKFWCAHNLHKHNAGSFFWTLYFHARRLFAQIKGAIESEWDSEQKKHSNTRTKAKTKRQTKPKIMCSFAWHEELFSLTLLSSHMSMCANIKMHKNDPIRAKYLQTGWKKRRLKSLDLTKLWRRQRNLYAKVKSFPLCHTRSLCFNHSIRFPFCGSVCYCCGNTIYAESKKKKKHTRTHIIPQKTYIFYTPRIIFSAFWTNGGRCGETLSQRCYSFLFMLRVRFLLLLWPLLLLLMMMLMSTPGKFAKEKALSMPSTSHVCRSFKII